ncbi:hypothetical protein C8Q77DRAFT_1109605 [Trametes polyzona]|nr:hypothetical protein C8Q77DRAFT_1109605 [Trametes polyzona]
MSIASSSSAPPNSDSWGGPVKTTILARAPNASAAPVRDDWDEDEDEAAQQESEDPQRLWEEANQRAPMPQVVIANTSTSVTAALSPPPAALQPVLRILKRPSASSPNPSPSATGSSSPGSGSSTSIASQLGTPQSYAAREAAYHAARERIFGESTRESPTATTKSGQQPAASASVPIAREPKGPPSGITDQATDVSSIAGGQAGNARGFANRRGRRRGAGRP